MTGLLSKSSGYAKWSPPPSEHHNGVLLGYKIQIKAGNSSKVLAQDTLNATTLQVMLHNLTVGATYNIRVVAYNRVGPGPYSPLVPLVMDPAQVIAPPRAHPSGAASASKGKSLLQQTWFLVVLSVLLILILAMVVSGAWYFRKKHLLTKELGHLTGKRSEVGGANCRSVTDYPSPPPSSPSVPVVSASELTAMNGKESLWIDRGWRVTDTDKDSGVSEAKLLVNNPSTNGTYTDGGTDYAEVDTRNMSTFYNCRKVS